jgi:hypothetical protein
MSSALSLHTSSTSLPGVPSLYGEIVSIVRGLIQDFLNPYRPEQHYMRGPGPKWRAKHQAAAAMQRSADASAVSVASA